MGKHWWAAIHRRPGSTAAERLGTAVVRPGRRRGWCWAVGEALRHSFGALDAANCARGGVLGSGARQDTTCSGVHEPAVLRPLKAGAAGAAVWGGGFLGVRTRPWQARLAGGADGGPRGRARRGTARYDAVKTARVPRTADAKGTTALTSRR
jgi:hypothetical protein